MKTQSSQRKTFSEELKKKIVKDIEEGKVSISRASHEYSVSDQSIYNWLYKYSKFRQKGVKLVVEMESEFYRSKELSKRVAELEQVIGQKQMVIDYLEKMIELASEDVGMDIKKKFSSKFSTGSGSTPKNTPTK
jgi:transposase